MHIGIISLFPGMFDAISAYGITSRALEKELLDLHYWNPRDFADPDDNYSSVDDRPYGGGPGMVMLVEPLKKALTQARAGIEAASGVKPKSIYLSPQGKRLDQQGIERIASYKSIVLLCGRYEGVDERLIQSEIDEEWSIGDYVISGGELAAMVLIDGITRLLPEALGHEDSASEDSFFNGLLDYPHYTRPEVLKGEKNLKVPDVLLSGHHENIRRWRLKQSLGRTWQRRPDLLESRCLSEEEEMLLAEFIREQKRN